MAKKTTTKKATAKAAKAPAPKAPVVTGATSGVMAVGPVGKAARAAAHSGSVQVPGPTGWRDPNAKYADDDTSIDARMWRLSHGRK
jgi:pyocin large subunit-like protein